MSSISDIDLLEPVERNKCGHLFKSFSPQLNERSSNISRIFIDLLEDSQTIKLSPREWKWRHFALLLLKSCDWVHWTEASIFSWSYNIKIQLLKIVSQCDVNKSSTKRGSCWVGIPINIEKFSRFRKSSALLRSMLNSSRPLFIDELAQY